jgi:hypothetical protein
MSRIRNITRKLKNNGRFIPKAAKKNIFLSKEDREFIKALKEDSPDEYYGHFPITKLAKLTKLTNFNKDFIEMNNWNLSPETEPHFATGSFVEVLKTRRCVKFVTEGINQVSKEIDYICHIDFDLANWISANFISFEMYTSNRAICIWAPNVEYSEFETVMVNLNKSMVDLNFEVHGPIEAVKLFEDWTTTQGFKKKDIMVEWVFGPNYREMEGYSLPLQIYPEIPGAYPWMTGTIPEYTKQFIESKESVLVLKGQPGTSKTSFIKRLIEASRTSAMVTYDTNLLFSDGFFASFMTRDNCNLLIIEDADSMLTSRTEGNPLMDKLLNASDGLISLRSKKIVFSTNLSNVNTIDPALLRKGRCYDILDFRRLTLEEATVVAKNYYGKEVDLVGKDFSLAEITNIDLEKVKLSKPIPKLGFVG